MLSRDRCSQEKGQKRSDKGKRSSIASRNEVYHTLEHLFGSIIPDIGTDDVKLQWIRGDAYETMIEVGR